MKPNKTIIYANVLLKNNKIINWKTSFITHWDSVETSFNNRQIIKLIMETHDLSVNSKIFYSYNKKDEEIIFNKLSREFYSQWIIHEEAKNSIRLPY